MNKVILVSPELFEEILAVINENNAPEKIEEGQEKAESGGFKIIKTANGSQILPLEGIKKGAAFLATLSTKMEIGADIPINGLLKLV